MKAQINKKLLLNKETLRVLTDNELNHAAGGISVGRCITVQSKCDICPTTTTTSTVTITVPPTTTTDFPTAGCPTL